MEYKKLSLGGYNLHLIKTDKFKISHIEVIFHNNLEVEDITKRQFLTRILTESNKTYPTNRKLLIELENLYDSSFYGQTTKVGNSLITSFGIDFLNPEYADKSIVKGCIKLLFDMLLNPNVNISEFDNKTFSIIKERVKDSINHAIEDPKRLSLINALKHLGNTPSAYNNIGSVEQLDFITPTNLYEYYQKMIKNDYIDIFVVGNLDMEDVTKIILAEAKFNIIKNHKINMHVSNSKQKESFYHDSSNNFETNIVCILNLNNLTTYEERYVANIYNNILGQNSLKNKLFQKLREDNSLCYGVSSFYQKYDGLIIITTGVDPSKTKEAIKLIKESLKEMNNNITDEEIDYAKEQIISSLNYSKDDMNRIIDNYFYYDLKEMDDIDTRLKTYKEVTKDEIYALSKKVSISIIYTLDGGQNE